MKSNKSKFLFVLVLAILLISLSGSFIFAQRELEVGYPEVGGETITPKTTLPEYVVYVFNFSLMLGAFIASAVLIYGGVRYVTSADNPEVKKDAKDRMFSGILGLVILFSSYLILVTVNPDLASPDEEPLQPTTGIYLINAEGEKLYYIEDTPKVAEEFRDPPFGAVSLMFLSGRDELSSVFIYPEKNREGGAREIENNEGTQSLSFSPKSLYFLWVRAGVYLYEKAGFGVPPPPKLYRTSAKNLKAFDNKTKSIKIKDVQGQPLYLAILFSEPDFEGKGGIGAALGINYSLSYVENNVSSIDISRIIKMREAPFGEGEIIFYDDIDCRGASQSIISGSSSSGGASLPNELSWLQNFANFIDFSDWQALSFKIKGNCWVMFNTKEDLSGRSQSFREEGCYPTLKGSYVYHPHPEEWKPRTAAVFYSPK